MDLLNDCEWEILKFSDCWLVTFNTLSYWQNTYEECVAGIGHKSFELYFN